MTINIDELCNRLAVRFGQIERIEPTVVRFTRKAGNRAFAVCYIDIASQLPSSPEALDEYQDRIVGRYFFDGAKSLQWSNYLFFVLPLEQANAIGQQSARLFIERDRKYARKFVIAESELDVAIAPPVVQPSCQPLAENVLTTWINLLAAANLDRAILNDESLPRRLELIEASFGIQSDGLPAASFARATSVQPFIRSVELKRFREFPTQREFTFGSVNLICGANGTGKTSLLEAIELSYCGRTKRNSSSTEEYNIHVAFSDGTNETATQRRTPATFKDRNLVWYGQSDVRSSTLHQTFSQFNFLNTDAAVALAEAKDDLEENLSKLLVGPETAKTWKEIQRTSEKVSDKIKELMAIRQNAELELLAVNRRLNATGNIDQVSDAILSKLQGMLKRENWALEPGPVGKSIGRIIALLSELEPLVKHIISLNWGKSPVTLDAIQNFLREGEERCKRVEALLTRMSVLRTDERKHLASISGAEAALELLSELLRFVEAGFPQKLDDVRILEGKLSGCRQILSGISREIVEALPSEDLEQTVLDRSQILSKQRVTAETVLKAAKENYARFAALRDANAKLSQEMRSIASRLIEQTETIDVCPLCHTRFPPGELMQHMQQGLDRVVESEAKKLLGQIQNYESQLAETVKRDDAAKWLMDYCERLKQPQSSKHQAIIANLSQARSECNSAFARLSAIRGELTLAASEGLSVERYQQLLDQLVGELDAERAITGEAIRLRMERYSQIITNAKQNLGALTAELITLQQSGEREFETHRIPQKSLASALSELKEQLAAGASMYDKLQVLLKSLLWPPGSPLSDLLVTIQSIREVAADFQSTFAKEQTASIVIAESTKKKVQLETQLAGLIPRIDRFSEAFDVLTRIQEQHSLTQGVETALRQNRIAIESIFSRIHAPAEFSGLGDSLTTLVRKDGGALANLQQISTGQRAAFALSLFLAQNAQLKTAPPVILIDDPIAHVDDLNCLSFLDYLRELAVSGGRQIIFATANDKLATLFERKFDFLGAEDFRRYDLKR